jgi:prepilin-type N-terminal cleavage/methylation domain-containing protein
MIGCSKRKALTLPEFLVVIVVFGLVIAVAAPRLLDTSATATDNRLRQTLATLRDAIEMYAANNDGRLPGCTADGADFRAALAPYLRGEFPKSPIAPYNALISGVADVAPQGDESPIAAWKFSTTSGVLIANSAAPTANHQDDAATTYDKL